MVMTFFFRWYGRGINIINSYRKIVGLVLAIEIIVLIIYDII